MLFVMREFVNMEDANEEVQHALVNFYYYLTIGDMDEAHRAVKLVKSTSVWENMAKARERKGRRGVRGS
ncbi:MAG: hypothetical protein SGPRY_001256 [Prymnesium sp.]